MFFFFCPSVAKPEEKVKNSFFNRCRQRKDVEVGYALDKVHPRPFTAHHLMEIGDGVLTTDLTEGLC